MEAWDDVRYLLALIRYGTVRAAAGALKVNHTTVSRRIRALERRSGCRLVQRTPDGYALTRDGAVLFDAGEAVERELESAAQRVQGADRSVRGKVRIALPDLLLAMLAPWLREITREHEGLELEICVSSQVTDVARRAADLALRFSPRPPDDLVGRKLGRMPAAVYAAKQLQLRRPVTELGTQPWVRWQEPWKQARVETWIDEHFPDARAVARVDNYAALETLVVAGAGVAILAPWTADHRIELEPLCGPIDELGMDLWLLMHPDLRGVRRVKAVADVMTHAMAQVFAQSPAD